MKIVRNGKSRTMKQNQAKYQKLEETVDIGNDFEDIYTRGTSKCSICLPLLVCLDCLDWLVSWFIKLQLCAYRGITKRYPHFLEDNGKDWVREEYQRLLQKNNEMTEAIKELRNEVDIKTGSIKNLEQTNSLSKEKIKQREMKILSLEKEKRTLEEEKQVALTRLSEQMAVQLRDNNPNIVDLNDQCRPTKLAEMFTELYDNEWTDAFSCLDKTLKEEHAIIVLLDIFMEAYSFCQDSVTAPWSVLNKWFLDMNIPGAKQVSKWLKDSRKANIRNRIMEVKNGFNDLLRDRCNDPEIATLIAEKKMIDYITKCIELCLLMVSTDPPVIARCQVWTARNDEKQDDWKLSQVNKDSSVRGVPNAVPSVMFDKDSFKEYTTRGYYLDYIVWPVLFLHEDGPLLSKGIAQGRTDLRQEQRMWTWTK